MDRINFQFKRFLVDTTVYSLKGAFYGLLFGMLFRMPKLTLTMPLGAGIGAGYAFHQAH